MLPSQWWIANDLAPRPRLLIHSHSKFNSFLRPFFNFTCTVVNHAYHDSVTSTIHSSNFTYRNAHDSTTCGTISKAFSKSTNANHAFVDSFFSTSRSPAFALQWKWRLWYLSLDWTQTEFHNNIIHLLSESHFKYSLQNLDQNDKVTLYHSTNHIQELHLHLLHIHHQTPLPIIWNALFLRKPVTDVMAS